MITIISSYYFSPAFVVLQLVATSYYYYDISYSSEQREHQVLFFGCVYFLVEYYEVGYVEFSVLLKV